MLAGLTQKKRITAPEEAAAGGGLPPWKIVAFCPIGGAGGTQKG
jgi:hypothetical protein